MGSTRSDLKAEYCNAAEVRIILPSLQRFLGVLDLSFLPLVPEYGCGSKEVFENTASRLSNASDARSLIGAKALVRQLSPREISGHQPEAATKR